MTIIFYYNSSGKGIFFFLDYGLSVCEIVLKKRKRRCKNLSEEYSKTETHGVTVVVVGVVTEDAGWEGIANQSVYRFIYMVRICRVWKNALLLSKKNLDKDAVSIINFY